MTENSLFFVVIIVIFILFATIRYGNRPAFANKIKESQTQLSSAVTHIQEHYQSGFKYEAVNILDIHLDEASTKLELGIPDPLHSLQTVSQLVSENNERGHRIIGATNASFYLDNGFPANLLVRNNKIIHFGILGEKVESPTQKPVAFGISKTGQAIADYFSANLVFTVNGKKYPIHYINHTRGENKTVLYTPEQIVTGRNEYVTEIVVVINGSQNTNVLHFGDCFTGKISTITPYGQGGNAAIPENGFIISIANKDISSEVSRVIGRNND